MWAALVAKHQWRTSAKRLLCKTPDIGPGGHLGKKLFSNFPVSQFITAMHNGCHARHFHLMDVETVAVVCTELSKCFTLWPRAILVARIWYMLQPTHWPPESGTCYTLAQGGPLKCDLQAPCSISGSLHVVQLSWMLTGVPSLLHSCTKLLSYPHFRPHFFTLMEKENLDLHIVKIRTALCFQFQSLTVPFHCTFMGAVDCLCLLNSRLHQYYISSLRRFGGMVCVCLWTCLAGVTCTLGIARGHINWLLKHNKCCWLTRPSLLL